MTSKQYDNSCPSVNPAAESRLEIALAWARDGFPVFPIWHVRADRTCACGSAEKHPPGKPSPIGKHPRTRHGHLDATTDEAQIRRWWSEPAQGDPDGWQCCPESNIGIALRDGDLVVDVDFRNDGEATLDAICADEGWAWLTRTRAVQSGSGAGYHWFLQGEPGRAYPKILGPGIDLKQLGGYVVAPGSNHKSGGRYEWESDPFAPIKLAPPFLLGQGELRGERGERETVEYDPDDLTDEERKRARAIVTWLEDEWVEGIRHHASIGLGGWLRKQGYSAAFTAHVVGALPSTDPKARVDCALWAYTVERAKAPGWSWLVGRLKPDVLRGLEKLAPNVLADAAGADFGRVPAAGAAPSYSGFRNAGAGAPVAPVAPANANGDMPDTDAYADDAIRHLAHAGIYQRAGMLVDVVREAREDPGAKHVRPIGAPSIRVLSGQKSGIPRLGEVLRTRGFNLNGLAATILARGQWDHIPPLDGIAEYPVLRPDGTLLVESGYDSVTRTLAHISIAVDVPAEPTQADALRALDTLHDLVSDFPFVEPAHRDAWVCALLTPLARPAIDGPTPLAIFEASQPGSGKTLLTDLIGLIVQGSALARRTAPETQEEWKKALFACVISGDPIVLIDNVTGMLRSATLDAILTGTKYQDRVLGVSEERKVPIRGVFYVSANNCAVSSDLIRRSLQCRLEPESDNPSERTGFRIADIKGYARERRAALLSDALTILRAYAAAGRPDVGTKPMGSFDEWSRVVRDAIVWAGGADAVTTQAGLRESADVESDALRALHDAWGAKFGTEPVNAQRVCAAACAGGELGDALESCLPKGERVTTRALGYVLRRMKGKRLGGVWLAPGPDEAEGRRTWRLFRAELPRRDP